MDWHQQTRVVCDLERAAASQPIDAAVDIRPWMASYFLFQCYVAEFGVVFDEQKACYWIAKAAENEDGGGVNYYAQAWLFRMHIALRVPISLSPDAIRSLITISVFRGHRTCIEDAELILQQPAPVKESMLWRHPSPLSGDAIDAIIEDTPEILRETLNLSTRALHTTCAAVGMPYFLGRKLKKQWNLDNLQILDGQIQEELGRTYSHSLLHGRDSTKPTTENGRDGTQLFDKIYVNHRGHGLLHLASAMGNLTALTHLLSKYKTDIDLPNKSSEESPLVCSCRAGHFDCSMLLLKHGANPSGHELGGESPLHWLCSFSENEMPVIAKRLQAAGAPIEEASGTTRADVRNIWADWEELYTVCVTPLGRAVIMKSLPAVRVLLTLGANPLARPQLGETGTVGAKSAVELAAVLTLPEILDVLLTYLDMVSSRPPDVLDEVEMLRSAHSLRSITPYDPTTLQSRLVRCGRDYKICLHKTMEILQQRRKRLSSLYDDNGEKIPEGDQLCQEIRLGNFDVVETLLNLGQDVNGFLDRRPVVEAVLLNAENIFRLLISYGADPFTSAVLDDCHPMSLLQVSASKPKTSRPGLHIANHLIKSGVAIDPTQVGQRSAFVLAVKNHDFELADLLLNYGADINFIYQLSNGGDWVTVLHELLQHHSEKNLKAIEYVLGAGAAQHTSTGFGSSTETPRCLKAISASSRKPDLVCNKTTKTSALQILALCSPETWNTKSQVSSRITQVLLAVFNTPDDINYQHPIAGTALLMACFSGNLEVVTALLACKADKSISIDFANSSVVNTLQGRVPVGVPLLIAKLKLFIENGINPQGDELPRLKSIVEMLTGEEMQEDEITTEGIRSVQFIDADAPDQGVEDNDSTYRSIAVKSPQPGPQGATSAHGEPTVQTSPAPHKFEVSRIPRQAHRTGTSQESINHSLSAPDSEIIRVQYNSLPMNVDLQTNKDKEHEHLVDDWVKRTTQDGQSYPVKYLSKTTSWPHSGVLNPNNNPSQGWEARKTQNGELYYIDRINKTTTGERSQSDRKEITYALSSGREGGQTDKGRLYGVDHNSERTSWVSPQVKVRPPLPFRKAESLRPPELPPRRPVLPPRRPFGA